MRGIPLPEPNHFWKRNDTTSPITRTLEDAAGAAVNLTGATIKFLMRPINGTTNNGAASAFAQSNAFGNNRRGAASLYNGSLGFIFDNSALDARSFSLTGQDTPKPAYDHASGFFTLGGPLKIPHLFNNNNAPVFFVSYQWTRNRNAVTQSGLVPTLSQRTGLLTPSSAIVDPTTSEPFAGNGRSSRAACDAHCATRCAGKFSRTQRSGPARTSRAWLQSVTPPDLRSCWRRRPQPEHGYSPGA